MRLNVVDNKWEEQTILICKRNLLLEDKEKVFLSLTKLWRDCYAMPEWYDYSYFDGYRFLFDIIKKYVTDESDFFKLQELASPENCWKTGFYTHEGFFQKKEFEGIKYDYWTACFFSAVSWLQLLEVKKIPYKLTEVNPKYLA
jgi:hypothetical protein